jgi:hypothetical protein
MGISKAPTPRFMSMCSMAIIQGGGTSSLPVGEDSLRNVRSMPDDGKVQESRPDRIYESCPCRICGELTFTRVLGGRSTRVILNNDTDLAALIRTHFGCVFQQPFIYLEDRDYACLVCASFFKTHFRMVEKLRETTAALRSRLVQAVPDQIPTKRFEGSNHTHCTHCAHLR